jgi:hypothetical protein
MHRDPDSVVTFQRKVGKDLKAVGAIRLEDLEGWFPDVREHLARDAYFGINGRAPQVLRRFGAKFRGGKRHLSTLSAAYLDFDCGKGAAPLTFTGAVARLMLAQDAGILPPVSLYQDSGNGAWAFWLLRDRDRADRPPHAHDSLIALHGRIERALLDRALPLRELAVDPSAIDAARITRVPGSINTKSGTRVAYYLGLSRDGAPVAYTLDELTAFLGIELEGYQRRIGKASEKLHERAVSGWRKRWQNKHAEIELLDTWRGGFREGMRGRAVLCYAIALHGIGVMLEDAMPAAVALGSRCRTADGSASLPLAEDECIATVRKAYTPREGQPLGNAAVARWLAVTADEGAMLDERGFALRAADSYVTAGATDIPDGVPRTRAEKQRARRAILAELYQSRIGKGWPPPTLRELRAMLDRDYALDAAIPTLRTDLLALGLRTGRERGGSLAPTLPLDATAPNVGTPTTLQATG